MKEFIIDDNLKVKLKKAEIREVIDGKTSNKNIISINKRKRDLSNDNLEIDSIIPKKKKKVKKIINNLIKIN